MNADVRERLNIYLRTNTIGDKRPVYTIPIVEMEELIEDLIELARFKDTE